jgi:hypothetical protein
MVEFLQYHLVEYMLMMEELKQLQLKRNYLYFELMISLKLQMQELFHLMLMMYLKLPVLSHLKLMVALDKFLVVVELVEVYLAQNLLLLS